MRKKSGFTTQPKLHAPCDKVPAAYTKIKIVDTVCASRGVGSSDSVETKDPVFSASRSLVARRAQFQT